MNRFINLAENIIVENLKEYINRMLYGAKQAQKRRDKDGINNCYQRAYGGYIFATNCLLNWNAELSDWWMGKEEEFKKLLEVM